MTHYHFFIKRTFDLAACLFGLIVLSPVFVLVMAIVKLSSRGPVLYRQKRVGRHGKRFTCFKFRTMYTGADRLGSITAATDSRITPAGRWLRKFKLDELPQLWNVLAGNMSFVGPRPDVPGYADALSGDDRVILELRPGITGPASLFFRNEEELLAAQADPKEYNDRVLWPAKVRINRVYYQEWGFWKDVGYIIITVAPAFDRWFGLMKHPQYRL